ncbi:MAG TPA: sugar MFS transporter [Caulobacteraceae bacterium]|jgi:FHS family L-fucose permease-like MFS transporter|nr:sugar MFS transporter [Caulobacteraceae bacterium]
MAGSPITAAPTTDSDRAARGGWLTPFVVALFFAWGFATVLLDTLIPKLKALFSLNYAEAMLVQFCFFIAYLIVSVPAGLLLSRIGYLKATVAGLLIMAAGCLLFAPAARLGVFAAFLLALFVMASGITVLQVAANPLMALLGPPRGAHARLNLAQAFNSLGTVLAPLVGAATFLASGLNNPDPATTSPAALAAFRRHEAVSTQVPFIAIAAGLVVLALIFWFARRHTAAPKAEKAAGFFETLALLRRPKLALGTFCIFIYVGAEVAIGSLMTNYLLSLHLTHEKLAGLIGPLVSQLKFDPTGVLSPEGAGRIVACYWFGAMVGRFLGSGILLAVKPGRVLLVCAVAAAALAAGSASTTGLLAAGLVVAIGLFNSVMFPTVFTMTIEGLGADTPKGSSLLCMAIVGGAVVPWLTGQLADAVGLHTSLLLPCACYLGIAAFAFLSRSRAPVQDVPVAPPAG